MTKQNGTRAFITGITGQDGSYLAELLLEKGYEVWGLVRRASTFTTGRIEHLYVDPHDDPRLHLVYGDVTDAGRMRELVTEIQPAEVYHLAAQSHVGASFELPTETVRTITLGTLNMLEACRADVNRWTRFYHAASSEMFGTVVGGQQNEDTPLNPQSPYACAKVAAYHLVRSYRKAYGMFAVNGILFNHESPRRGETFVTRKITRAAGRIAVGLQNRLYLGNPMSVRDWGYAPEYMRGVWQMMQCATPEDWVLATGEGHRVLDWVRTAFELVRLDYAGYVKPDNRYFRPNEVDRLIGDASKAHDLLGWRAEVGFGELCRMMTDHDYNLAREERGRLDEGTREGEKVGMREPVCVRTRTGRRGKVKRW